MARKDNNPRDGISKISETDVLDDGKWNYIHGSEVTKKLAPGDGHKRDYPTECC